MTGPNPYTNSAAAWKALRYRTKEQDDPKRTNIILPALSKTSANGTGQITKGPDYEPLIVKSLAKKSYRRKEGGVS
jgi:hypothetical protein